MAAQQRPLDILSRLAAQPAVAFWESGVAATVTSTAQELGLGTWVDAYGNIIAKVEGTVPGAVPLALVAHMDHPGFEATEAQDDHLISKAMGGVPPASFGSGVPLHLILGYGRRLPATTAARYGEESERRRAWEHSEAGEKYRWAI